MRSDSSPYRNRRIRGPLADFLHFHPYDGLEICGRLGWFLHPARSWLCVEGISAPGLADPSQQSGAAALCLPMQPDGSPQPVARPRDPAKPRSFPRSSACAGQPAWLLWLSLRASVGYPTSSLPLASLVKGASQIKFQMTEGAQAGGVAGVGGACAIAALDVIRVAKIK